MMPSTVESHHHQTLTSLSLQQLLSNLRRQTLTLHVSPASLSLRHSTLLERCGRLSATASRSHLLTTTVVSERMVAWRWSSCLLQLNAHLAPSTLNCRRQCLRSSGVKVLCIMSIVDPGDLDQSTCSCSDCTSWGVACGWMGRSLPAGLRVNVFRLVSATPALPNWTSRRSILDSILNSANRGC